MTEHIEANAAPSVRQVAEWTGLKVIGAGFGRTGTLSLKSALEILGFSPCYHMLSVLEKPSDVLRWEAIARGESRDWRGILAGYQATVDWPAVSFYKELFQEFPDAKVVLSVRDPERWYESSSSTIYQMHKNKLIRSPLLSPLITLLSGGRNRIGRMVDKLVWHDEFHDRFEDKAYALEIFNRHIEEVKLTIPANQLLVYEVKQGWGPLCEFLGVEVPAGTPFPRLNERDNFVGNQFWKIGQRAIQGGLVLLAGSAAVLVAWQLLRRGKPVGA